MPKVYLTEKDRLCSRLAKWVYGEMRVRRISQQTLSKKMGIAQQSLSRKLKEERFSYDDFAFFVKEFRPTDGELREIIGL